MKTIQIAMICLLLHAQVGHARAYTVRELIVKAQESDYTIRARSEKVYQARQRIKVSIGRLLPGLNFGSVLAAVEQNYVGLAASMFGFLFPSNWFQWKESKLYFQAEKRTFATLIANEVNAVESLAYRIHNVQRLKAIYETYLVHVGNLVRIAEKRAELGEEAADVIKRFDNVKKKMENDLTVIETTIVKLNADLADTVGIDLAERPDFGISPVDLPDLSRQSPLDSSELVDPVLQASMELQAFEYLRKAAKYSRIGRTFEFLTPGGDADASFGFGYFAYIKIGESKETELEVKEEAMESDLVKTVEQVVTDYNATLELYARSVDGFNNAVTWYNLLEAKFEEGGEYEPQEYIEAIESLLAFASRVSQAQHKFMISKAQVDRLTWSRSYYKKIWKSVDQKHPGELGLRQKWENWKIKRAIKKGKLDPNPTVRHHSAANLSRQKLPEITA